MPVHRERTDPIRTPVQLEACHRRWILPDDVGRPVLLQQAARLWRGLLELGVLDGSSEAQLERTPLPTRGQPEESELPAAASAGALLAGAGFASAVSQVVFPEEGQLDPYREEGPDPGYREYTLYVVDSPRFLLLPLVPDSLTCAACGDRRDLGRDRGTLRSGATFLLEELCARAALSIELPRAPADEEMPDAAV